MDIGYIDKTTRRIRYICRQWNVPNRDIEDCTQHIFLKRLEGKARHQLLDHSVVDWLRHYYGMSKIKPIFREFDPKTDGGVGGEPHICDPSGFFKLANLLENPIDRDVVIRRIYFDESLLTISEYYGVTTNRISQRFSNSMKKLRKILDSRSNVEMPS